MAEAELTPQQKSALTRRKSRLKLVFDPELETFYSKLADALAIDSRWEVQAIWCGPSRNYTMTHCALLCMERVFEKNADKPALQRVADKLEKALEREQQEESNG